MFRFASPWLLLAAIPAVLLWFWWWQGRRQRSVTLQLPQAGLRLPQGTSAWVWVDRSMPWLRLIALLLLVTAWARPQSGSTLQTTSTLGVDIVMVLDTSHSMTGEDFQPNRLSAAKRSMEAFVAGRGSDRIGLVAFGGVASTRCPLTLDHDMLLNFLEQVDFSPRSTSGTAIGLGLATAVNRLRDSDAESKIVVLLTDGENNEGQISPQAAAQAAKALDVRVYTIGVGTAGGGGRVVPRAGGLRAVVAPQFELDEELLKEIASVTDGEYFNVTNDDAMEGVFETIDKLEKTEIESTERVLYDELFNWFVFPALLLLLAERLLMTTRLRRIP